MDYTKLLPVSTFEEAHEIVKPLIERFQNSGLFQWVELTVTVNYYKVSAWTIRTVRIGRSEDTLTNSIDLTVGTDRTGRPYIDLGGSDRLSGGDFIKGRRIKAEEVDALIERYLAEIRNDRLKGERR